MKILLKSRFRQTRLKALHQQRRATPYETKKTKNHISQKNCIFAKLEIDGNTTFESKRIVFSKRKNREVKEKIILFCTLFALLFDGYAQSNRVGVYVYPQANFFIKKKTFNSQTCPFTKGNGFTFDGGIYFEKTFGCVGLSAGIGYTQLNNTYIYISATAVKHKETIKMGFIAIPFGGVYEYQVKDNISVGVRGGFEFNYLVTEKQIISGLESSAKLSDYEFIYKLHYQVFGGPSATYLFDNKMGLSATLFFSAFGGPNFREITYLGIGGQIRFFYAFGK